MKRSRWLGWPLANAVGAVANGAAAIATAAHGGSTWLVLAFAWISGMNLTTLVWLDQCERWRLFALETQNDWKNTADKWRLLYFDLADRADRAGRPATPDDPADTDKPDHLH